MRVRAVFQRSRSVEGGGDGEEGEGFGEGRDGVVGGEGAEGGEPEGGSCCTEAEEAAGEAAEEDAGEEIDEDLDEEYGVEAFLSVGVEAEDAEAEGEEKGVAGQAEERGADGAGGVGDAVDAVAQEVVGDVGVEEGVALDVGVAEEEEEAEEEAGGEGEEEGGGGGAFGVGGAVGHVGDMILGTVWLGLSLEPHPSQTARWMGHDEWGGAG